MEDAMQQHTTQQQLYFRTHLNATVASLQNYSNALRDLPGLSGLCSWTELMDRLVPTILGWKGRPHYKTAISHRRCSPVPPTNFATTLPVLSLAGFVMYVVLWSYLLACLHDCLKTGYLVTGLLEIFVCYHNQKLA